MPEVEQFNVDSDLAESALTKCFFCDAWSYQQKSITCFFCIFHLPFIV